MIDEEDKMQGNHEASSVACLNSQASHFHPQEKRVAIDVFAEGNNKESDRSDRPFAPNKVPLEASPANPICARPIQRQEACSWQYMYPDYQMTWQNRPYASESPFYQINQDRSYPMENRMQFIPFKMFSHGYAYPYELQLQEFQYFVVIDFEATCDKGKNLQPQEIIEFPSVLVNSATGQLEASFQTYVRPTYHHLLTDFCKELTGIQQIQVDRGVSLNEALLMHDKWLEEKGIKHTSFAVVTWSNWDCHIMLESECRFKRIRKPPYFNRWINLRVPFHEVFGDVRCNLKEAVQMAGLTWEGRAHCGLDDARNTARLLALLMHRGFKFSITNSLLWPSAQTVNYPPPADSSTDPKDPVPPSHPHPYANSGAKERVMYCYCGAQSSKCMVRKPGPMQGRCFFGCGNWSATRRAVCNFFLWAS